MNITSAGVHDTSAEPGLSASKLLTGEGVPG